MKGLPKYAAGDIRDVPLTSERWAALAAQILERIAGEYCAPVYVALGRYAIVRISGDKQGRG
jgi:hypothetical protein